ncbi:MAG: DUF2235 domain-containing protein [Xanthobacteraceae bacterium]
MAAKNILVFADGTGNEGGLLPDESRTNVYQLYCATRVGPDSPIEPEKQLALYVPGVGTPIPGTASHWQQLKETAQQAYGGGITKKIIDCYVAIIGVWRPGDRIYLFGFSRGAYTVRCLAHVLELIGIPTQEANGQPLNLDPTQLRKLSTSAVKILYRFGLPIRNAKKRDQKAEIFRSAYKCISGPEHGAVPYFIGVWDTVAALGWAHLRAALEWVHLWPLQYDEHFPSTVRFARHAMAVDEYRKDFVRVPWGGSGTVLPNIPGEPEQFQQIWFAGNHADIGGSYPENESRLSDITLMWMADFIEQLPAEGRVYIDRAVLKCSPSSAGMMHDECMVGIGGTPLRWGQTLRTVPTQAVLHETVYERLRMEEVRNFIGYGPYRPASLQNHEKTKQFYQGLPGGTPP